MIDAPDTLPGFDLHKPWKLPNTWAGCSGGCDQGRRLCVTPEACRLSERETRARRMSWPVRWPFTVALVAAAMLWVVVR